MKIYGLQKMTLLDFPGKVACTVFLGQCDFRCPYCHNFELVDGTAPPVMDEEELYAFLEKRKGLLDGVAVTGGEPCLHKDLPNLLARIKEMGFMTKLDTNGNHPAMLREVTDKKLADYIAMDIKNCPAKYAKTIGLERFDLKNIYESIEIILGSDIDYEFRTTVLEGFHDRVDFERIGEMIGGAKRYFIQPFADRDSVPFAGLISPNADEIKAFADTARKYVASTEIRGMD